MVRLRKDCPCDLDGFCPYATEFLESCYYWCGEEDSDGDPDTAPADWTYYDEDTIPDNNY